MMRKKMVVEEAAVAALSGRSEFFSHSFKTKTVRTFLAFLQTYLQLCHLPPHILGLASKHSSVLTVFTGKSSLMAK